MNPVEVRGQVSVPSRGLSYLNAESEYIEKPVISVSVPSRGLSYLNLEIFFQSTRKEESFRPLTGTLLSKHNTQEFDDWVGDCFRPLTGTLLSKRENISNTSLMQNGVSVPSRGLSYLNIKADKQSI